MTQSGKSELLNHLASAFRWQRVLVDTKDEWTVPGVEPVHDVAAIDWREPIVHYRNRGTGPQELGELFDVLNQRRRVIAVVHELLDLCDGHPSKTPRSVLQYLTKGAAHGRGFLGGSQRPVMVPSHARTEAAHIFIFTPRLTPDDLKPIARELGTSFEQLARDLDEVQRELGDHAFVWFNRRTRDLSACEPLDDATRSHTIVHRAPGV
jgi:hypothetical protein